MQQLQTATQWYRPPNYPINASVYWAKNVKPKRSYKPYSLFEESKQLPLEEHYTFTQSELLKEKLKKHPDLVELLVEAYKQIENYFGDDFEEVELKHEVDPEFEDEGLFFITIRTKLPLTEARVILNKFNDEWFLNEDMQMLNSIFTVIARPYDF